MDPCCELLKQSLLLTLKQSLRYRQHPPHLDPGSKLHVAASKQMDEEDGMTVRCFGEVYVATAEERERLLCRSLRIFGLSVRGRPCQTTDLEKKTLLHLGGLELGATPEMGLDALRGRVGRRMADLVKGVCSAPLGYIGMSAALLHGEQAFEATKVSKEVLMQCNNHVSASALLAALREADPMVQARWADAWEERAWRLRLKSTAEYLNDSTE